MTASSGDTKYAHLKIAGDAYEEIRSLKIQVGRLKASLAGAQVEAGELKKDCRSLKKSLSDIERSNPLNGNDERMLIQAGVTISFRQLFTEGCRIVATRNGRTLTEVSGSETASLLPQVLRKLRKKLRDE
ncbi:MAG: hypothetical protein ACE5D3_00020 [Candidatus Binatia bacterium]